MKKRYIIILLTIFTNVTVAQYRDIPDIVTKVATSAGNWLKLETSVRSIGMGGASVAVGSGVSSIPSNPASLAYLDQSQVYISRTNYLAGISYNVISVGSKLSGSDFFAFHLFYLDSGPIEVTNEWYPNGTGENFNVTSISFRMSYARNMTDRLKLGVTVNYIRDEIYTTKMQAFAFDIGSSFNTGIYGFILGMSVSNFGPEVQYHGEGLQRTVPDTIDVDERLSKVTEKYPLPLSFRLGIQNDVIGMSSNSFVKSNNHRLSLAIDGSNPNDYTLNGNMGLEYAFKELAFLRVGTHVGHDTAGFSTGGGITIGTGNLNLHVDYAFVNYDILNVTHQIGIRLAF